MRMASMVQMYPPHEHREQYNYEGYYGSNSAALISSQFAFNVAPAPATLLPCNDHIRVNDSMWEVNKGSPKMEGPFTPVPLSSSAGCTQQDDHFSYLEAITRSINSDILSFNNMAACDMGFPFAEENQLVEVMGLQRSKLSMYSSCSYGVDDDHDLSQESNMATAAPDDEKESVLQACSDGDKAKMGNLARSFTFPPAGASSCAAGRAPLILTSDAEIRNPNPNKHFNHQLVYRENSSATTTSCSNGDEGEPKGKDVTLKIEGSEILDCMLGNRDQQGCIGQNIETSLSSRGYKQCKKRSANMGNSNTSVKAARLNTPPDVVHVRARRGQATDSHSLAERVRREKISQRMKVLQEIVPGCHKVLGKAMMLDEIINYVKSLQKQVEFLSMKLAAANQAGMASMIANEVKFWLPNMEFFGDFNSSCQVIKSEPLMHSLIQ